MDLSPFGLKMKRGKGLSLGFGVLHRVSCLAKNMGLKWRKWPMLGSTQMTKWGTWPIFSIFIWHKYWIPPEMTKWGTFIYLFRTEANRQLKLSIWTQNSLPQGREPHTLQSSTGPSLLIHKSSLSFMTSMVVCNQILVTIQFLSFPQPNIGQTPHNVRLGIHISAILAFP